MHPSLTGAPACVGELPESAGSSASATVAMSGSLCGTGARMRFRRRSIFLAIPFGARAFLESWVRFSVAPDSQFVTGLSGSGGGGVRSATGPIMNEKFYESHVFGVPWEVMVVDQPFLARFGCSGGGAGLLYASEPDPLWHNDFRDPGNDPRSSMIGLWGPLYPRQGRAFHGSDVVASALLSYRAMDLSAGVDGKEIQLGYPTETSCMTPGTDPQSWDYNRGKQGTGGKYLWVYWTPVTCCVQVN